MAKIRSEDLAAHPAARFINLQPKSAAKILSDMPKLLDQSLQLLAD
ncbi:MAG TPA: hypothetical protein VFC63_16445 [Blastocatellia bacterium]|nr:hypothetical protein [Blastocatellia bacterium]